MKISPMQNHPPGGGVKHNKNMKQIKLEVGKTYLSRKGEEVRIVEKCVVGEFPCKGNNDEWYAENGRFSYSTEDPLDLIEEVPETRHTFAIPDGVKKVTVEQVGNRIVVEMVPEEKEPKPETMQVEDVPESTRIWRWVEEHLNDGYYNQKRVAEAIEAYLKYKEGKK